MGLGYYVGLRRAEIASLTGSQVSERQIRQFIRKGNSEHTLPWATMVETVRTKMPIHRNVWLDLFCDELVELSRMVGPHPLLSPWVPKPQPGTLNKRFSKHGLGFTPHNLRHSCATNLVACGVPTHIVKDLLNHRSIQTTLGYVRVSRDALGDWLKGGEYGS